jgi:REP element-mobilizing transposase RayT
MPRKARIDAPGALNHIIVRGIERRKIFYDDKDRDNFIERLGNVLTETNTPCFAWALIPNHLHLLLRTGNIPIATIMRRLLTGYAVTFNRRYRRHGHLFQNRYKSILCQEDLYLLELVRYIHLNPLRSKIVKDIRALKKYPYSGHTALMGQTKYAWQDTDYILKFYHEGCFEARRLYKEFVIKGIPAGRRPVLVGGGLIRSAGGWSAVKTMRRSMDRMKGDERILGNGDFVESVLRTAEENLEQKYELESLGYDFNWLVERVAEVLELDSKDVVSPGKYRHVVQARSLLCFWAVRKLGMTTVNLSERLKIAQPTVSQAVVRGQKIAEDEGLSLMKPIL